MNKSIKSTVAYFVKKFDTRDPFEIADRLKVEYIIGPMGNYSGCYLYLNTLFHSHCLRHTHGTILAENGVNPKTVMERLGHKDIKTTLQTYTFNTNVMQQTAVDVFEKAVK